MPGIRARHEEPVERIVGSVGEGAFFHLVVAGVFMQQTRKNGGGHVSADSVVGERRSVAFSVSAPALSPRFGRIVRLVESGEKTDEWVGEVVSHSGGGKPELLAA